MITRQHSVLSLMAYSAKADMVLYRKDIVWILLPDGIRAYSGPRQMSHFESTPDGKDNAWMIFPNARDLKLLSKENFKDVVKMYIPEGGYPKCVIGEQTMVGSFDAKNYGHPFYHPLRMHMQQDCVLDLVLREVLVDVKDRFNDRFTVRWNKQVIDGATLRKQVAMFENLGFIHLAGKVYERTGKLVGNSWFEEYVHEPLLRAYPKDLAESTFKYIKMPEGIDLRIMTKDFDLTEEDKEGFILCAPEKLEEILDVMYAEAYRLTACEL